MGIRAHKEMTVGKAFRSMIVPWHVEWLSIWLYLGFAIYFWIQCAFLFGEDHHQYKFKTQMDYQLMFVAAFGISLSLSITFAFLVFYSNSKAYQGLLEAFDYMGKLIWVYFYTFAFVSIEMMGTKTQFLFSVFVVLVLAVNLVML